MTLSFIQTPKSVSSLALTNDGLLAVGSEDGSCRVFRLPETKVYKAIKLGDEITGLAFVKGDVGLWIACGRTVYLFNLTGNALLLTKSNASKTYLVLPETIQTEEDVLNDIALSTGYLGYTSDSGIVGIVDIKTGAVTPMRTRHSSIAGSISFIPDRPREVVSGGYDSTLIHHDISLRTVLSKYDLATSPNPSSTPKMSLSPPFILSLVVSDTGLIAAGTADGRLWLGRGGEKIPPSSSAILKTKKKKKKYWEGLKDDESSEWIVAEGPVVGIAFQTASIILTVTLHGILTKHHISHSNPSPPSEAEESRPQQSNGISISTLWQTHTTKIVKVNALHVMRDLIVVGGVGLGGNGFVEIWDGDEHL